MDQVVHGNQEKVPERCHTGTFVDWPESFEELGSFNREERERPFVPLGSGAFGELRWNRLDAWALDFPPNRKDIGEAKPQVFVGKPNHSGEVHRDLQFAR
ncbi:MAG: hypothetical protein U0994_09895 [Gemmatimonadales bacterium]|nr:hypothetical protein [Gemmatimonadales bacterium]